MSFSNAAYTDWLWGRVEDLTDLAEKNHNAAGDLFLFIEDLPEGAISDEQYEQARAIFERSQSPM